MIFNIEIIKIYFFSSLGLLLSLFLDFNFYFCDWLISLETKSDINKFLKRRGKVTWLINTEAGVEQCHMEQQLGVVLCGLIDLAVYGVLHFGEKFFHETVMGIDLHGFFGEHVAVGFIVVLESLGLVYFLHGGGISVLGSQDEEGVVNQLVGDHNLLDIFAEELLPPVGERLVHFLELLELLLGHLIILVNE
jgi:hypothetical protein